MITTSIKLRIVRRKERKATCKQGASWTLPKAPSSKTDNKKDDSVACAASVTKQTEKELEFLGRERLEHDKAVIIQCQARRCLAKARCQLKQKERQEKREEQVRVEEQAALVIQCMVRSCYAKKEEKKEEVNKGSRQQREATHDDDDDNSTSAIQVLYEQLQGAAAVAVRCNPRRPQGKEIRHPAQVLRDWLEDDAAVIIQCMVRSHLAAQACRARRVELRRNKESQDEEVSGKTLATGSLQVEVQDQAEVELEEQSVSSVRTKRRNSEPKPKKKPRGGSKPRKSEARRRLEREVSRLRRRMEKMAAVVIQCRVRSYLAKVRFEEAKKDRIVKMEHTRILRERLESEAVVVLQCLARTALAKARFDESKELRLAKLEQAQVLRERSEADAAVVLQCMARTILAKARFEEAVKAQQVTREKVKQAQVLRERSEAEAAVVLQCMARTILAKARFEEGVKTQQVTREKVKILLEQVEGEAAVVLQCSVRTFLAKDRYEEELGAREASTAQEEQATSVNLSVSEDSHPRAMPAAPLCISTEKHQETPEIYPFIQSVTQAVAVTKELEMKLALLREQLRNEAAVVIQCMAHVHFAKARFQREKTEQETRMLLAVQKASESDNDTNEVTVSSQTSSDGSADRRNATMETIENDMLDDDAAVVQPSANELAQLLHVCEQVKQDVHMSMLNGVEFDIETGDVAVSSVLSNSEGGSSTSQKTPSVLSSENSSLDSADPLDGMCKIKMAAGDDSVQPMSWLGDGGSPFASTFVRRFLIGMLLMYIVVLLSNDPMGRNIFSTFNATEISLSNETISLDEPRGKKRARRKSW